MIQLTEKRLKELLYKAYNHGINNFKYHEFIVWLNDIEEIGGRENE